MPDSFAESAEGIILAANGIDPVVRWDGYTTTAEPAGVQPPDQTITPTIAGSGSGTLTGSYQIFVRFVDANDNPSNPSPVSAAVTVSNVGQFDYGNLPVPAQASIVRRQVLRNTDGEASVFYVSIDTTDLTSTTLSDSLTDAQLSAQEAVPLLDGQGLPFINSFGPPPSTKPFLAFHLNRMWLAGEQPYAEGSVQVVQGSASVVGVATRWPANFPGRFLYVSGAGRSYEILSVDPVGQTLVLTEPYKDATDPFAMYAIRPAPADAQTMYFSKPGQPEAWPPFFGFTLPEDGDQVTGLCQFGSFLWIFKRKRTYRMTAQSDPTTDGFIFYALGRGCINHRCWVVVEENLYLMDEGGIYRTGGGDDAEQLSTPIQNLFRRDAAGAINWSASRFFHCCYSPAEETIRWFLTLRGSYLPRHALCLHYKSSKWWLEEYPVPIGSSTLGRVGRPTGGWGDAGEQLFLGGPAGSVLTSGGSLDGAPAAGPMTRGSVSSATLDTLTDGGATFDPSWINVPVVIVAGRGKGQLRVVVANNATTLRVNEAWAVQPDATSQYQVGGIRYRFTGGRLRYAPSETQTGRSVEVQYVPTGPPETVDLRLFSDFAIVPRGMGRTTGPGTRLGVATVKDLAEFTLDLSRPAGHYWQRFDGHREMGTEAPRLVRVQLEGCSGPDPVQFGEMVLNGIIR